MLHRLFVDHPSAVGETYDEHRRVALSFAFPLISAGLACLVHAFVPGLFVRTGSQTIEQLHQRMVVARRGPNRTSGESHQDLAGPAVEA